MADYLTHTHPGHLPFQPGLHLPPHKEARILLLDLLGPPLPAAKGRGGKCRVSYGERLSGDPGENTAPPTEVCMCAHAGGPATVRLHPQIPQSSLGGGRVCPNCQQWVQMLMFSPPPLTHTPECHQPYTGQEPFDSPSFCPSSLIPLLGSISKSLSPSVASLWSSYLHSSHWAPSSHPAPNNLSLWSPQLCGKEPRRQTPLLNAGLERWSSVHPTHVEADNHPVAEDLLPFRHT